ncbi:MAG: hypothetical protein SGJ18_08315 [Pseudomonadota bacterium]|nr:hypothetical protein [Pseudomonadota bacterium]
MINGVLQFYTSVVKFAIYLALVGELKVFTLVMMNKAANAQKQMISYSEFTHQLTSR